MKVIDLSVILCSTYCQLNHNVKTGYLPGDYNGGDNTENKVVENYVDNYNRWHHCVDGVTLWCSPGDTTVKIVNCMSDANLLQASQHSLPIKWAYF